MEIKVNALVLKAVDYNENDKILTLLTAEYGKITAGIKGVKKPAAKLRFAAQPFCFAEYVLSEKSGKYTVINCSECESFFDLRTDICRFYAACAVIEAAAALTVEGEENADVFYGSVRALTKMCAGGDERAPLIEYLTFILGKSGYALSAGDCAVCGESLYAAEKMRFDMDMGTFTCFECGTGAGASRSTYHTLRKAEGKEYDEYFASADGEKRALRLIREYFSYKTENPLKSLSEYIRLI